MRKPSVTEGSEESDSEIGASSGPLATLAGLMYDAPVHLGDFSSGGPATDFLPAAPGLEIEGVGPVALPLHDAQMAEKIVSVCEKAPFGRGFDTVVDTAVRNSWQLHPSKVKITNPAWQSGLTAAAKVIADKFGVEGTPITLRPYKFLFYKEGGHFAKHRDTEKEDRMFATMVVQLPSAHTGGALEVYRQNEGTPTVHDFGAAKGTAPFQCHYAVHYADAEHALQPVTAGYRLAMVYSICWPEDWETPAPSLEHESRGAMIDALAQVSKERRTFHYFLEHMYTPKSVGAMGVNFFKGADRGIVANLRVLNDALPPEQRFRFYIAQAERNSSYYGEGGGYHNNRYDSDGDEFDDVDWTLQEGPYYEVSDLRPLRGGDPIPCNDFTLEDDAVLNPENKSRMALWRGHCTTHMEDYTGNAGPSKDTVYLKYVLIAWPANMADAFTMACRGLESSLGQILYGKRGSDLSSYSLEKLPPLAEAAAGKASKLDAYLRNFETLRQCFTWSSYSEKKCSSVLFTCLRALPDNEGLLTRHVKLLTAGTGPYSESDTLVTVARDHPLVWEAVQAAVVEAIRDRDFVDQAIELLHQMQQKGLPQATFAPFATSVLKVLKPASKSEVGNAALQTKLWEVVFHIGDGQGAELCAGLLSRYASFDLGETIKVHTAMVQAYKAKRTRYDAHMRAAIGPSLEPRISELVRSRQQYETRVSSARAWQFPLARFPGHEDIQNFLRGSSQTFKLTGFGCIADARDYLHKHCRSRLLQVHGSWTVTAGGSGRYSYVQVLKTDKYLRELKQKLARVDGMLPTLKAMRAVDAGAQGTAQSVSGAGADAEEPAAKKAKIEVIVID
ncbi:unnamed protein product [Tilletia controversa]|nr:unnamed protein product [Tilletia controversa]